jgi:O-antigen/teichoic acid export membrane protein
MIASLVKFIEHKVNRSVLGIASIYLGANSATAAISFLLLPIFTRVLTPAEYGTVAMFLAVCALLQAFTGLSIHGAVGVEFFKRDKGSFPTYVGSCMSILGTSTVVAAAVVLAASPWLSKISDLSAGWLVLAVFVGCTQFLSLTRLSIWQSAGEPLRYGVFQVLQTSVNAVLSLYLVLILRWGADGRIWGIVIATILSGLVALASLHRGGWIRWKLKADFARDALKFGLPLIPHTLGAIAVATADRFILTNKIGVSATGMYVVGVQLAMPMAILGDSINRAFVPWLYEKLAQNDDMACVAGSYLFIGAALIAFVAYAACVWLFGEKIVGSVYSEATPIALLLVFAGFFQIAYYAVANYFFYAHRTGTLTIITSVSGALYVLAAWLTVDSFGMYGLAVCFLITQLTIFTLVWIAAAKIRRMPWTQVRAVIAAVVGDIAGSPQMPGR